MPSYNMVFNEKSGEQKEEKISKKIYTCSEIEDEANGNEAAKSSKSQLKALV